MLLPRRIDFARVGAYLVLSLCSLFLYALGENSEPFSIALLYAMLGAGYSPLLSPILCVLPSLLSGSVRMVVLYILQALLVALGYFASGRLRPDKPTQTGVFPMLFFGVALGVYIAVAPFKPYLPPANGYAQKTLFAAVAFLLGNCFYVALRAMTRKFLKCRLRGDELTFTALFFVLVGVGACRFVGLNAYLGIAFFVLLLFACATQDATVLVCAFCLSLPPLIVTGLSPARFFLYGVAVVLFIRHGRLPASLALLCIYFGYGYLDGVFAYPTARLVEYVLAATLPCLAVILLPSSLVRGLENKLIFYREKHLTRIAINRNRFAVGEKLFEISTVFREIENAFSALDTTDAEEGAKAHIRACVLEEVCEKCPHFSDCKPRGLEGLLQKLVDLGCLKGRASLIDLPRALSELCNDQNSLLYALNRQLADYKRYMTEAENARSGRSLLAGQARGVSEILRGLALEQSQPLPIRADRERAIRVALLGVGIVCSELLVIGEEEELTLSLVTFGRADIQKIAAVATHILGVEMMISERLELNEDKFCCILRKKPKFDAAFGVASAKKAGETESGDTHSVIKLDERKFMVALSDGMGSGEYARKVSESAISLLESFYRAKMPPPLVLSAVNKLLTFYKEESFACVDIATVNLDDGRADIVKIGSPMGFILSGNTVKVLESTSLPMGILDSLRPDCASYTLLENDVLLFVSDGITDAFGSTADLYEALRRVPLRNPQQLADSLLEEAIAAYGGTPKDDMTAVAVRLYKPLSVA